MNRLSILQSPGVVWPRAAIMLGFILSTAGCEDQKTTLKPEPDCDAFATTETNLGRAIVHPRNLIELPGTFTLRNTSDKTVSDAFHFVFESLSVSPPGFEADGFSDSTLLSLGPGDSLTIPVTATIAPGTSPGEYSVRLRSASACDYPAIRFEVLPEDSAYVRRDSPGHVLDNLEEAYRRRDGARYPALLADDFRFFFDEGTRQQNPGLPVFWTRLEDSLGTSGLFSYSRLTDIRISLQFGAPRPANEIGRERWVYVDVLDTFLEVDLSPDPGQPEGITLRVDGQQQRFYFRKGRTEGDTEPQSPTSDLYYLVEWKDYGLQSLASVPSPSVESITWSKIKTLFFR